MVDLSWSQGTLEMMPKPALRIVLEVLLDPDDESAVISVEARTYPDRTLVALHSAPAVDFASVEHQIREIGLTFTELVREHTGPF